MDWVSVIPQLTFAVFVIYAPGLIPLLFTRQVWLFKLALAPALSIVFSVLSGLIFGLVRVPWGWTSPFFPSFICALALLIIRLLTFRKARTRSRGLVATKRDSAWLIGFLFLSISILCIRVTRIFGSPNHFSQTYDNIFHLSVIRYSSQLEIGSPLLVTGVNGSAGSFYPNAFHNFAANVLSIFPDELAVCAAGVVLVFAAFVWPISCFYLVSEFFSFNRGIAFGTCVASASLSMMPMLLLDFGVLYPLLVAYCLVPVGWAILSQFFGVVRNETKIRLRMLLPGAVVGFAIALAHPSAIIAVSLIVCGALTIRGCQLLLFWKRNAHPKRAVLWLLLASVFCFVTVLAFIKLRPSRGSSWWKPLGTVDEAVGSLIVNSGIVYKPLFVVSLFAIAGLYYCFRTRKFWLLASWSTWSIMWIIGAAMPLGDLRWYATGVWYTDPYRLAAFTAITAVPVIALGAQQLDNFWRNQSGLGEKAASLISLLSIAACLVIAQIEPGLRGADQIASKNYVLNGESEVLTPDEIALLDEAKELLPEDAVVAVEPLNGSSLLYAFEGIHTSATHIAYSPTPEQMEICSHLDEASEMPQTCLAINELNVGYAIDFGEQGVHGRGREYPGFDSLENNPGFEEISRVGDKVLYKITACGK